MKKGKRKIKILKINKQTKKTAAPQTVDWAAGNRSCVSSSLFSAVLAVIGSSDLNKRSWGFKRHVFSCSTAAGERNR